MSEALSAIVRQQLDRLNRNPFEAARRGGLERSFVNDILIGRKKSVRGDNLARLAAALDLPVGELVARTGGEKTELRRLRISSGRTLRQVADATGVDIEQIDKAERGEIELTQPDKERLAEFYNADAKTLLKVAQGRPGARAIDETRLRHLLEGAFEESGATNEHAANVAAALIKAADPTHELPADGDDALRTMGRFLARLFGR